MVYDFEKVLQMVVGNPIPRSAGGEIEKNKLKQHTIFCTTTAGGEGYYYYFHPHPLRLTFSG